MMKLSSRCFRVTRHASSDSSMTFANIQSRQLLPHHKSIIYSNAGCRELLLRRLKQPISYILDLSTYCISTTNLAACVCVCPQNLTNFCPYAFISSPNVPKMLFAQQNSHTLPLDHFLRSIVLYLLRKTIIQDGFVTVASPHTGTCRCNDHGPTVLSARGQQTLAMTCQRLPKGGLIVAILQSETAGSELALDLLNIHR